jgi:two-component system, cell cycle sensor histidine kinase and response regulator CckA
MDIDHSKIKLLIIEDSEDDALLIIRNLAKSFTDLEYFICETLETFESELSTRSYNAIISDYNLNSFTGVDAYEVFKKKGIDIPFLIVSGQIGEELAVEAMKRGVHDYIMKDRLGRLVTSLRKELLEAQKRKEQTAIKAALKYEQIKFNLLVEGAPIGIAIISENGTIEYANSMSEKIMDMQAERLSTLPEFISKIFPNEEDSEWVMDYWKNHSIQKRICQIWSSR